MNTVDNIFDVLNMMALNDKIKKGEAMEPIRTPIDDIITISTVQSYDHRYGAYETAVVFEIEETRIIRIAEGYDTEEKAKAGHQRWANKTPEEIEDYWDWLD